MKKAKTFEPGKLTEFSQNIVQYQNQMLNTYVDLLKRELQNRKFAIQKMNNQNLNYKYLVLHLNDAIKSDQESFSQIEAALNKIDTPHNDFSQNFNLSTQIPTSPQAAQEIPMGLNDLKPFFQCQQIEELTDELKSLRRDNDHLTRKVRILCSYDHAAVERNVEQIKQNNDEIIEENFACVCGAQQIIIVRDQLIQDNDNGYNLFIRSACPVIDEANNVQIKEQQIEPLDQPQLLQGDEMEVEVKNDNFKQIITNFAEEKSNLLKIIEEQKLSYKIQDEYFFQSQIFETLSKQNYDLVNFVATQDRFIRQLEDQLYQEIQSASDIQQKLKDEYQQLFNRDLNKIPQQQPPIQFNQDNIIERDQINAFKEKIMAQEQCEESLRNEQAALRLKNKNIISQLDQEQQKKQEYFQSLNNLKAEVSGIRASKINEPLDGIILRYDKHKVILQEIENEFAAPKGIEYLQKFKELVGYLKMRDDKVKGLEHQIEMKVQDLATLKKQIESMFDELDYNSQVYAAQMEKNKVLNKLLEETQKNEVRGIQERINEKQKLEFEKQSLTSRANQQEQTIKALYLQIDLQKNQSKLTDQERFQFKDVVDSIRKNMTELKDQSITQQIELDIRRSELKMWTDKQKMGEIINQKYIKAAEISKSKQKALKIQLKQQHQNQKLIQTEADSDLVKSLKTMVNCQQCKKKLKETILVKCLHMFCKGCLDDNLKNRNRACSICRTRYGQEDVKPIKFN